jgi:hypothetical protein
MLRAESSFPSLCSIPCAGHAAVPAFRTAAIVLALSAGILLAQPRASVPSEQDRTAKEIEAVEREIDRAIVHRDTATLATKLTTSFIRIHTLGPVEDRDIFIKRIAAGNAMERQRTDDAAEFDIALSTYGRQTAIRRSRVRFRFASDNRENWLLLVKVFVREADGWRLASWHGTALHNGPITDASAYQNLAGNYVSDAGEHLILTWHGGGMLVRWPLGVVTQIFPVSLTEFQDGISRLRFTPGSLEQPASVAQIRDGREVWRGRRSE